MLGMFSSPISLVVTAIYIMSEPGLPVFENRRLPGPHVGLCFPPHFVDKAICQNRFFDLWEPSVTMCPCWGMSSHPLPPVLAGR